MAKRPISHKIVVASKLDDSKASVYTIDENLSAKEIKRCKSLLCNPLIETTKLPRNSSSFTEIGFLPGVTDNVGNTATEMLGHKTYFSQIYFRDPPPFNPLIQRSSRNKFLPVPRVVLPKPKETQMKINPSDLKFEVSKATGPGGQNVNKRMTAVRVVHLPTGLAVDSHTERNMQQNKENALAILSAKLFKKQEMARLETLSEKRKTHDASI